MNEKKRNLYMDYLKGIAIVAMIIGHSISDISGMERVFNFIYSFHMPLLVFVSAYIEEENKDKYSMAKWKMLCKRTGGLIIPYFGWIGFKMLFFGQLWTINYHEMGAVLMEYHKDGLWFLPLLFGLKVLHYLYWNLQAKMGRHMIIKDISICIMFEVIVLLAAIWTGSSFFTNILSYAIPYFFAVILIDNNAFQRIAHNKWIVATAALLYVVVFPFFSFYNLHWSTQVLRIALSLCVIIILINYQTVWNKGYIGNVLCIFGNYSLAIYLLHGPFINYKDYLKLMNAPTIELFLAIILAFFIGEICVVIARIMEISPLFKKILLGK